MTEITAKLFELKDEGYKSFSSSLMPSVNSESVIGIRVPLLRKYASEIAGTVDADRFLKTLPHTYFEEYNLHAFLVEKIRDFDRAVYETERFLPYIDNWATCDMFRPGVFGKNKDRLLPHIKKWLRSEHTYTVRYGIGMLLSFYLDGDFREEYLKLVSDIRSEEYYVKMMIAWYFATALAKQYESALPYIENKLLDKWTHNKAIQKAIESRRIDKDIKQYLRIYKI